MPIIDNRLSDYVIILHEIAREVRQKFDDPALSETLRKSADKLSDLAQSETQTK
jgi:hypothetical protein